MTDQKIQEKLNKLYTYAEITIFPKICTEEVRELAQDLLELVGFSHSRLRYHQLKFATQELAEKFFVEEISSISTALLTAAEMKVFNEILDLIDPISLADNLQNRGEF